MKVLLVDNDLGTGVSLTKDFMHEKYVVNLVTDGETALQLARCCPYDLIVLNLLHNSDESLKLCEQLRENGYRGAIFMLARMSKIDAEIECIRSLDAGANDCMVNPYEIQELLSRMQTLLSKN